MKSAVGGMESRRRSVWNHHEVMYGINPKENARWRVMPYAYGDSILTCGEITYQSFGLDKKRTKHLLRSFFGWGTGIRTPVMTESESVALPLGDAPIFSTLCIIADILHLVNTYFQLFLKKLFPFQKKRVFLLYNARLLWYNTHYKLKFLPVAQLDSASDSDSEGQRFKSVRVGQTKSHPSWVVFCMPSPVW